MTDAGREPGPGPESERDPGREPAREPAEYVDEVKHCYYCNSSNCRFAYFNNHDEHQPRYRCENPACRELFTFYKPRSEPNRPKGKKYKKVRGVDPEEIQDLYRQCPNCNKPTETPFKYYNNNKNHSNSQPCFKCLNCKELFFMRLVTDGTNRRLIHSKSKTRRILKTDQLPKPSKRSKKEVKSQPSQVKTRALPIEIIEKDAVPEKKDNNNGSTTKMVLDDGAFEDELLIENMPPIVVDDDEIYLTDLSNNISDEMMNLTNLSNNISDEMMNLTDLSNNNSDEMMNLTDLSNNNLDEMMKVYESFGEWHGGQGSVKLATTSSSMFPEFGLDGENHWESMPQTTCMESMHELAQESMQETMQEVVQVVGEDVEEPPIWGIEDVLVDQSIAVHQINNEEQTIGNNFTITTMPCSLIAQHNFLGNYEGPKYFPCGTTSEPNYCAFGIENGLVIKQYIEVANETNIEGMESHSSQIINKAPNDHLHLENMRSFQPRQKIRMELATTCSWLR